MDKLQWFKFSPSDWTMGRISRLPVSIQGEYIRFCCIYWNKECNMTIEEAELEFTKKAFNRLLEIKVLKTDKDNIKINFLDNQMEDIEAMRVRNSEAGKLSAEKRKLRRETNARSTPVQRNSTEKIKSKSKSKNIYRSFDHLFLTIDDYNKLLEFWSKENVEMVLDSIQNYKKNKNYKSLYLTARSWLRDTPKRSQKNSEDSLLDNVKKQM